MNCKSYSFGFLILVSISQHAFGQTTEHKFSALQESLIRQIAKDGTVKAKFVSRIASTPPQWSRADSLDKLSSNNDLSSLTSHQSPAVKIYAFQFLLDRNLWQQALTALKANTEDKNAFYWISGCMGGYQIVSSSMAYDLKSYFLDKKIILDPVTQKEADNLFDKVPDRDKEKKIIRRNITKLKLQRENSSNY